MRRTLCSLALLALLGGCTTAPLVPVPEQPTASTSAFPCPEFIRGGSPSPQPSVQSGRVQVGRVSYPTAPAPFSAAGNDVYIPFANLVGSQAASVEQGTQSSIGWDSVVTLARLSSVDGAWGGPRAAEVVSQCSLSMTWLGIDYHPTVSRDEAITVDGHDAWIRITDLSFTVPGITATSEVQTVIIVQLPEESYTYLSYLPNSAPELKPIVDATREGLQVSG